LNRGSLNSAHIHGTHVPVEEPSTASIPDSCAAASNPLFDHFIGECEGHSWNCEAERFGSVEVDD
jgi:hypothetical protein